MAYVHNRRKPRFVSFENVLFSVLLYIKQKQATESVFYPMWNWRWQWCFQKAFFSCVHYISYGIFCFELEVFIQAKFLFLFMQESFWDLETIENKIFMLVFLNLPTKNQYQPFWFVQVSSIQEETSMLASVDFYRM